MMAEKKNTFNPDYGPCPKCQPKFDKLLMGIVQEHQEVIATLTTRLKTQQEKMDGTLDQLAVMTDYLEMARDDYKDDCEGWRPAACVDICPAFYACRALHQAYPDKVEGGQG
jgi:hypothetical protein